MKDGIACRLFKSLQALSLLPCLWLFLFFCSATALSNADAIQALIVETSIKPVFIHESDQRIDLKPFMLVFHDPDNSLTWNDVLADDSDVHWMHVSELDAVKHIGGRHWFKVNLKVDETTRQRHSELILHFPYQAILMQEMVLQINGDGNLLRSGLYVDKKARAINHSVNSLPIVLDTENVQLLGYVQNNYLRIPAHFEFQLSSQKDYLQQFQQGQYLYVAFYAIMAALLIYNLCLFLTIRQPLYGVYCLFIISTAISCALNDGNALLWLWPGQFAFNTLMSYATSFIPPMLFLSFVYLATEKSSFWPGFRFVYLGLNVSGFLLLGGLLLLPQSGGAWILLVVDIYPAIILATIFTLIIAAVYQRQALSQYLMLAEIVLLAGGVNYALANQGIIALTELSNWSLHAGVVAEALLLAITLAARTRDMQLKALEQQALAYQYQSDALVIQENADRLKTEFMSTITHELLTPINGITLSHNLLQDAVGEEKHRLLASAKTSTTQLLHLVESMLVFSEARIEQLVLHPEPVDLTAYLNELLQQYLDCSHSYAKLELHYDRSQPYWILVDRKKLDILLHQLIKNAMQNTVQGKVVISCVVTTVNESEVLLSLSINNQGLSMPVDVQDHLRKSFDVDHDSPLPTPQGIGMGLSIVCDLLHLMRGSFTIASDDIDGCCFKIDLPLRRSVPQASVTETKKLDGIKRVLIVEDNPVNMLLMEKILQKHDFQTFSAEHGALALEVLNTQVVDVVLMDCNMPVLDGYATTKIIRQNKAFADLPIIAVTANVSEQDQQRCQASGMNDFIAKPANMAVLTQTINRWLKQAS